MRALVIPALLATSLTLAAAEGPRFIKVDIVSKNLAKHARHHGEDGPTEVHMRLPVSLAKGVLDMAGDGEIKVNGKARKGVKPEQLQKLLAEARPGDLLLEITTDKGDHVRVTIE